MHTLNMMLSAPKLVGYVWARFTREQGSCMYRGWVLPVQAKMVPKEIWHGGTLMKDTLHWHSVATRDEDKGGWGVLQQLLAPEVAKAFHGPCNKALQNLAITHPEVEDLGHFEVQLHSCWTRTQHRVKVHGKIYWAKRCLCMNRKRKNGWRCWRRSIASGLDSYVHMNVSCFFSMWHEIFLFRS